MNKPLFIKYKTAAALLVQDLPPLTEAEIKIILVNHEKN